MASQNTKPALWKASAWLLVAVSFALGALQVYRLGNLAVSISLCLVSLAICSYVVYLSYPHVTQWILDRRSHLPWGYRLTREGVFYSLVVIVVASAAAFSGNNLLYLVFSCLLAAILLAGFVSRLVLSGLQLDVRMPDHIFARQPVGLRVTLKNLKRLLPSFSIWISITPEVPRSRRRRSRRKEPARTGPASGLSADPVYCPMIAGGHSISTQVQATFPTRGRFQNEVFWLRTKFPFSFVERLARLHPAREITVYPSVESSPAVEEIVKRLAAEHASLSRGESHDLYRIRPAAPGDGARLVNWKATARSGQLLVKEFTRDDHLRARIVFDPAVVETRPHDTGVFERVVQQCAAVVWRLYELRAEIRFDSANVSISTAGNPSAVFQILRYLATVQPRLSNESSEPGPRHFENINHPMRVIFGAKSARNSSALQSSIESPGSTDVQVSTDSPVPPSH